MTDGIWREGEVLAAMVEPPNFFLSFDPSLLSVRKPSPIVVVVKVNPQGSFFNPVRLEVRSPDPLIPIATFNPPIVKFVQDTQTYEPSTMTIPTDGLWGEMVIRIRGTEVLP